MEVAVNVRLVASDLAAPAPFVEIRRGSASMWQRHFSFKTSRLAETWKTHV